MCTARLLFIQAERMGALHEGYPYCAPLKTRLQHHGVAGDAALRAAL